MKASPKSSRLLTSVPISSSIISRPVALGYDFVEDRVYWTDVILHTISRSFLNGSMEEVIFNQTLQTPDGLAVDHVGRNLYWTDTGTKKLEVSKLDGSYRKTLIISGLDEPRDIILDVVKWFVLFNFFKFGNFVASFLLNFVMHSVGVSVTFSRAPVVLSKYLHTVDQNRIDCVVTFAPVYFFFT